MEENIAKTPAAEEFPAAEALPAADAEALRRERDDLYQTCKALEQECGALSEKLRAYEGEEGLYRAASRNAAVKGRILEDYLGSLKRSALPVLSGGGVSAPERKPRSVKEAGELAKHYFQKGV